MDEMYIKNNTGAYPIYIGYHLLKSLNNIIRKDYSSILIITDSHVAKFYLEDVIYNLGKENVHTKVIQAGEFSKNIHVFYDIHTHLMKCGMDRQSLIIALGGGVVGDIAGFVAATYMRGIDYIQLPTTILAHDSSVGGKVAINHENGKNMIGSFYPPAMVIFDINTLLSLPLSEIRSGYAELIKEALINDETFFEQLIERDLNSLKQEDIHNHIRKGISIKAEVVEKDEKEQGVRKYLNLGHTLGHALETSFGYGRITHGEAVAVGLLFAMYVSEKIYSTRLPFESLFHWLKINNYPLTFQQINISELIRLMKKDKKAIKNSIQMVLLKSIGLPTVQKVQEKQIKNYLKSFFQELGCEFK